MDKKILELKIILGLIVSVLVAIPITSSSVSEIQITMNEKSQKAPAIYEDIIVWEDFRNGYSQIYGYNIAEKNEFHISKSDSNQYEPAIWEDIVVWRDDRNGNWDIYGYNLKAKKEFQISEDLSDQFSPGIFRDVVIYTDSRNGSIDIFGYNLSSKEEIEITTSLGNQMYPVIYENLIIWQDDRNWDITEDYYVITKKDIYGYNLLTGEEFVITRGEEDEYRPAIYDSVVTWTEKKDGTYNIFSMNLSTMEKIQITTSTARFSAIWGDIVVWETWRNNNWDIYGYNLLTKKKFVITTGKGSQVCPSIYGNQVVWEHHNPEILGFYNCDIYMAIIGKMGKKYGENYDYV